jgi:hypothetical protein
MVAEYQKSVKSTTKIDSIQDMQNFVESFPEFRQLSGNVSKHVAVMGELSSLVDRRKLMAVGELVCKRVATVKREEEVKITVRCS